MTLRTFKIHLKRKRINGKLRFFRNSRFYWFYFIYPKHHIYFPVYQDSSDSYCCCRVTDVTHAKKNVFWKLLNKIRSLGYLTASTSWIALVGYFALRNGWLSHFSKTLIKYHQFSIFHIICFYFHLQRVLTYKFNLNKINSFALVSIK